MTADFSSQLTDVVVRCLLSFHPEKELEIVLLRAMVEMLTIGVGGMVSMQERCKVMCLLAMVKSDLNIQQLHLAIFLTKNNQIMDHAISQDLSSWHMFCTHVIQHPEVRKILRLFFRCFTRTIGGLSEKHF